MRTRTGWSGPIRTPLAPTIDLRSEMDQLRGTKVPCFIHWTSQLLLVELQYSVVLPPVVMCVCAWCCRWRVEVYSGVLFVPRAPIVATANTIHAWPTCLKTWPAWKTRKTKANAHSPHLFHEQQGSAASDKTAVKANKSKTLDSIFMFWSACPSTLRRADQLWMGHLLSRVCLEL